MNKKIIAPEIGTGLEDAQFKAYLHNRQENTFSIEIVLWNEKVCRFEFYEHILFVDRGAGDITAFCIATEESALFQDAIRRMAAPSSSTQKYKLFQFLDLDDEPCLEIVCTNFSCRVLQ